jgi:hypothetical protein
LIVKREKLAASVREKLNLKRVNAAISTETPKREFQSTF